MKFETLKLFCPQNAEILYDWVGLRPHREPLRVERELISYPSGELQVWSQTPLFASSQQYSDIQCWTPLVKVRHKFEWASPGPCRCEAMQVGAGNSQISYQGTEAEIQLPLKRFPDSSVSSLIPTGWCRRASHHQKLAPTFPGIDSCLMVTKEDFLEMEASLWLNERSQNVAKGRLST